MQINTNFLFEGYNQKDWKDEWENMPEFIQEKQEEYQKIIVRFESEEAVNDFAKLIEQKITCQTQSIWHPKLVWMNTINKRYIDES